MDQERLPILRGLACRCPRCGKGRLLQGFLTLRPSCEVCGLDYQQVTVPTVPVVHEASEVRRWMADEVIGHADVWVADLDGTVVGLMVLDRDRDGSGWIEQLYLDPAWMGRVFWIGLALVLLWPLGVATEFKPWVLFERDNLKVTAQFLGSFLPLALSGEFLDDGSAGLGHD